MSRISILYLYLFVLAGVLSHSTLSAQKYVPIVFNPKIGANFSDFILDDEENIHQTFSHLGWNIGVDIRYGQKWMVKGGAHVYTTKAGVEWMDSLSTTTDVLVHTLKIPVGIGRKIYSLDYIQFWAYADGVLNLNFLLEEDARSLNSGEYNAPGASIRGGLVIEIKRFTIEGNYEVGLTNLLDASFEGKKRLVGLTLGVKF